MFKRDDLWRLISGKRTDNERKEVSTENVNRTTFLIAGLGNPGREYKTNRHNVGFMLVDEFCQVLNIKLDRVQFKALLTTVNIGEHRVVIAKPQTFMNLSGQAISGILRFYKINRSDMLIAHDDIDLPLGSLRIRPTGGSGGQKGIASIIQQLGTQDFPRLRIGINRPPGRMKAADYVLQNFSSSEMEMISFVLKKGVEAVMTFLENDLEYAMNKYNGPLQ